MLVGAKGHDVIVPAGREVNRGRATALAVCAVAAVGLAGSIVAAGYDTHGPGQPGTALVGALVAGTIAVVGAIVALVEPRNLVGWLMLVRCGCAGSGQRAHRGRCPRGAGRSRRAGLPRLPRRDRPRAAGCGLDHRGRGGAGVLSGRAAAESPLALGRVRRCRRRRRNARRSHPQPRRSGKPIGRLAQPARAARVRGRVERRRRPDRDRAHGGHRRRGADQPGRPLPPSGRRSTSADPPACDGGHTAGGRGAPRRRHRRRTGVGLLPGRVGTTGGDSCGDSRLRRVRPAARDPPRTGLAHHVGCPSSDLRGRRSRGRGGRRTVDRVVGAGRRGSGRGPTPAAAARSRAAGSQPSRVWTLA